MKNFLPILLLAYSFSGTADDIYDNSWALIIGIDEYENVQELNYAVKDAESIQDILVSSFNFPEDNITLLIDEEATKNNIIQSFSDIIFKAKENDRVLICFAGHGDTMDLPGGGEAGYLLPVDGNSKNLYVSSIGMDELKKISSMSQAKHVLFLVDACYGGVATIGSRGLDADSTPNYIEKITNNNARQIISAGGRGEKVIEKAEWGHSAFTLNLSRGLKDKNADLNGDGYITGTELGLFLNEKVTIDSDNQQTPQFGRLDSQEGEFVFIVNYNIEEVKEVTIIEESSEIDYDLLSSKIAEQLQNSNVDDMEALNTEKPLQKGPISWGIDFSLINSQFTQYIPYMDGISAGSGVKTSGYMIYLIPKLIYQKKNFKISIGYTFKELNKFHYQLSYDSPDLVPENWSGRTGRDEGLDLDIDDLIRLGFQYNIFKIGAFPIILNMDLDVIRIPNQTVDNEYLTGLYRLEINGGRYNVYSIGLLTQLMLFSNGINFEVGAYDVGHNLVNNLGNFHVVNPDIYLKIGYDIE
jgi:hypothetical protein